MRRAKVAVVEGDDAAPEAVRAAMRAVTVTGAPIDWNLVDVTDRAAAEAAIDAADATMFGATNGGPSVASLFYLRWGKRTFANIRPIRYIHGARSPMRDPRGIDLVIVRENLEDLYLGLEGGLEELDVLHYRDRTGCQLSDSGPGAFAIKVITERRTVDVANAALALARQRATQRGVPARLHIGTKHNLLRRSDGLFRDVTLCVAASYPDVQVESLIVDDLARRLVAAPHEFDVVLLPNLYGDVLSDVAAGLVGGPGLAPSGCYGHDYAYFEPSHGSAPDLAGKGLINPTAQLLCAAMLLEYLDLSEFATSLVQSVESVYASGDFLTVDQGGTASTTGLVNAVIARLG